MLNIKKLKFSGIGRFIEEQVIDFTNLSNLNQVDAENLITGGSSGSGKTTIFHAIEWLFGLSDLSTTILQSRLTKENISVSAQFDWDGKSVLVCRSKKLSIIVDGIETTGNSKIAEELLDQILGIPRNVFRILLHRRQNEQGFFLSMTPAKMNEFLTDCLGLNSVTSKVSVIEQKIKEIETDKTKYETDLKTLEASINATKSALKLLGSEPSTDVTEDLINHYKGLLDQTEKEYNKVVQAHKIEKEALNTKKPQINLIPFDSSNLDFVEKQIKNIELDIKKVEDQEKLRQNNLKQELSNLRLSYNTSVSNAKLENSKESNVIKTKVLELNQLVKDGNDAKTKALEIASQLKILKSGICHTCEQSWITEKSKEEERKLLLELNTLKKIVSRSINANEELSKAKEAYLKLNDQLNSALLSLEEDYQDKYSDLDGKLKPQIPTELPELKSRLDGLLILKNLERDKQEKHNAEQNSSNQKLLESFFLEQKKLLTNHEKELTEIKANFENTRSIYQQAKNKFDTHQILLKTYKTNLEKLNVRLLEMDQKVVCMNQKVVHNKNRLTIAEESKRCFKSYLSCSFDDALISISETATRILRAVPTMANATIRLEGTKELGSGAIKDQINACLDNDGEIDLPIKSLSGGERSAVDLAVDLAVSELISERTRVGINLLLLDETMNGFDTTGKENAIEMLKTLNPDKHVLIIEHDPIAKELINNRITVVRDGETSSLK